MLIKITEAELASRGFSLSDREEWFVATHPEWRGRTKQLLGVYLTCQSDTPVKGHVEFESALFHIEGCAWCRSCLDSLTNA